MPGAGRRPCVPAPAPPHPGPRAPGGAEGTDHGRGAGGKDRPLPCPGAEKAPAVESLGFGGGGGRPGLPRRAGRPARPEQRRHLHARDGRRPRRDGASRGRCRPGAGGRPPGGPCRGGSRLESALGGGPRLTGPRCGAALRGSLFRRPPSRRPLPRRPLLRSSPLGEPLPQRRPLPGRAAKPAAEPAVRSGRRSPAAPPSRRRIRPAERRRSPP